MSAIATKKDVLECVVHSILRRYCRLYPATGSIPKQIDALTNHIFNRYVYTWIVFNYVRYLGKKLKVNSIFIKGGSESKDIKSSGQGSDDVHAAHLARFRISSEFKASHGPESKFILTLLSLTENMHESVNIFHGVGGAIDLFSEGMIKGATGTVNFYTDGFVKMLKTAKKKAVENNEHVVDDVLDRAIGKINETSETKEFQSFLSMVNDEMDIIRENP